MNAPEDEAYRAFLAKLFDPLVERLPPGARGIDYGAGPGPTLSVMLAKRGFTVSVYDPFYADDRAALFDRYDFLTCTETVEHFCHPRRDWERMIQLVRPGGWIGIMTSRYDKVDNLAQWHYLRDMTHVCFYADRTLEWIANAFGMDLTLINDTVALFRR